jgi:hypothetical protein
MVGENNVQTARRPRSVAVHSLSSLTFLTTSFSSFSGPLVWPSTGLKLDLHFKAFLRNEREDCHRQAATKAIITGR